MWSEKEAGMSEKTWQGHVFIGMSVDGMIARKNDDIEWLTGGGEAAGDFGFTEFMARIDHLVMGRSTYNIVQSFGGWPYGATKVIVLSSSLETDDTRVEVLRSLEEVAARLNDDGARHVYVDGGLTIRTFLSAGLIDSLTLSRVPVLIGEGKPLFGAIPRDIPLTHLKTEVFSGGMVQSQYRVGPAESRRGASA